MSMFKRIKPVFEHCSNVKHPEHQTRNTRVSEYLRRYGQGKIDEMPSDHRPTVDDPRSVDEMLDDDSPVDSMAFDELDAIGEINRMAEQFKKAREEMELNEKQRNAFDDAVDILNDSNKSIDEKREAYNVISDLIKDGKVKRARKY